MSENVTFSLLHATARVPGWENSAILWYTRADDPSDVEHILVSNNECILPGSIFENTKHGLVSNSRGGTDQWNEAAKLSTGDILIKIADDFFPPDHWDTQLHEVLRRMPHGTAVIDVSYQSSPGNKIDCYPLIAHAILTRKYYEMFGYLEHPDYSHNMADVEFSEVARSMGVVFDARHLTFTHLNPEDGSAAWDAVYRRQRTPEALNAARELFDRRKKAGFPRHSMLEAACQQ